MTVFRFRMWLIAQGKEVYLNALKDPDSLSGVTPYGYCSFEALGYISSQVYSAMKGKISIRTVRQECRWNVMSR